MEKQLKFLEGVEVSQGFRNEWESRMAGWCRLHEHLVAHGKETANFYAKLLVMELDWEQPRLDIVLRLKGAFDVRRKRDELAQLMRELG
jgi:hypothetical protein